MRAFEIRPNRQLGQNFLIDSNILEVIARMAELAPEDVVLEIGGGLGVLSEYLAARVAGLHVIELDRRLEPALRDAAEPFENVQLHWGDAMTLRLSALQPPPGKLVANLPYGIAAGVLLRTIEELPEMGLWVAMVQREVGERLAATVGGDSGSREYGVSSVIAQLSCRVELLRAIPRTVFHPQPNVDSVLVRLTRTGPPAPAPLRAFVRAAFAHRRKALAGSIALAKLSLGTERQQRQQPLTRGEVQAALHELGHATDVRAERLGAEDFRALAARLGV
ncbi:MAG TPA: 16S rRNA (adenine(1518)-N(6)/adenine(1519)-N(6))-dimethyltransferase RsmA [Solirubrobacteraceae bacterium]